MFTQKVYYQVKRYKEMLRIICMMNCNKVIHDEIVRMEEIMCPFCNKELAKSTRKEEEKCCSRQNIINDNGMRVCKQCGQVYGYDSVREYVDFYANRYRIHRKSIYHRKYHIEKVILDNKINLSRPIIEKICLIFQEIENVSGTIDKTRKRMISVEYLLKRILKRYFQIEHSTIKISKSKKTLKYYHWYWKQIVKLINGKIEEISR